jgi:ATP-dependent protease ClpP protease subunit
MIVNRKRSFNRETVNKPEVNKTNNEATLYLYDEIGFWGINAQEFVTNLNAIDADTIHLRVDSIGGDVFAARAIQTALKQHKARIMVHIDGLAASAASFIAMAGDEIEMTDGGFMMIHKAMSFVDIFGYFNCDDCTKLTDDMGKEQDRLNKVDDSIANDYAKRTGKTPEETKQWMADESWFTAQESLDLGLIDRVYNGEVVENTYDLSVFNRVPDKLKEREKNMTKREIERILRDAGCSQTVAKAILAKGWNEGTRRDVVDSQQREVVAPQGKKDRLTELLTRAETIAPTMRNEQE